MDAKERITALRAEIDRHNKAYYELNRPLVGDFEFDGMMRELRELETNYPELASGDSPTQKVGGRAGATFEPVTHAPPLESLNDVFS
ncbi:MAG: NAD-dependent DNA ligase LigA, partial [Oscillospiraceae bacterium]|nr:NAD-dependent DNA ligase LigA [Oscillospiraceae bacterium]